MKSSARAGWSRCRAPADRRGRGRARRRRHRAGGRRARRGAGRASPTRPRSGPRACCCRAWSTRTATSSCRRCADAVPGGEGLVAWAAALMRRAQRRHARARSATPPPRRPPAAVALGTAAIGDVGNSLGGRARDRRAPAWRRALPRAARLARGRAPATRWRTPRASAPSADAPDLARRASATSRRPHAPYSAGPELLRAHLRGRGRRTGAPTSIHVAEDEDELALLRDGSGRWPALLAGMGVDPRDARARASRPSPTSRRWARSRPRRRRCSCTWSTPSADDRRLAREAGATVVLCPRSNLHIGGRLPDVDALLADGVPLALGTDSLASAPDLSLWAEMATLAAHFPAVPAARWLDAATRGGARALRPAARSARSRPGTRPGVLDVLVDDIAAPLESLVRDPTPRCAGWPAHDEPIPTAPVEPTVVKFGRMIKFEHTLFALPFALAAAALAARGHGLSIARVAGIVVAMAGARTAAMGFNRIVDRHIDAQQPAHRQARAAAGRDLAARRLGADARARRRLRGRRRRAGPALPRARRRSRSRSCFGYSFTKRFTALCHLFLGLAIAGGPGGRLDRRARRLRLGARPPDARRRLLDRRLRHPLRARRPRLRPRQPACTRSRRASASRARWSISALLHAVTVAALFALAPAAGLGVPYLAGVARRRRAARLGARHRPPERPLPPQHRLLQPERLRLGRVLRRHADRRAAALSVSTGANVTACAVATLRRGESRVARRVALHRSRVTDRVEAIARHDRADADALPPSRLVPLLSRTCARGVTAANRTMTLLDRSRVQRATSLRRTRHSVPRRRRVHARRRPIDTTGRRRRIGAPSLARRDAVAHSSGVSGRARTDRATPMDRVATTSSYPDGARAAARSNDRLRPHGHAPPRTTGQLPRLQDGAEAGDPAACQQPAARIAPERRRSSPSRWLSACAASRGPIRATRLASGSCSCRRAPEPDIRVRQGPAPREPSVHALDLLEIEPRSAHCTVSAAARRRRLRGPGATSDARRV